jgi:hypothetical protein
MVAEIASPESRPLSGIAALAETVRRARSGHKQQDQHMPFDSDGVRQADPNLPPQSWRG